MKKTIKLVIGCLLAVSAVSKAATVNVGAVANSTTTGQFLSLLPDGVTTATTTTGLLKVGFFDITTTDLQNIVASWSSSAPGSKYAAYNLLNSHFTQIGTVVAPATTGGTLGEALRVCTTQRVRVGISAQPAMSAEPRTMLISPWPRKTHKCICGHSTDRISAAVGLILPNGHWSLTMRQDNGSCLGLELCRWC